MPDIYFDRVVRLAAKLPGVRTSQSNKTPALKVRGKCFARMKEKMDGVIVVMIPLGLKELLIETEPEKYFETPHYAGWPAMLVRLDAIDDRELEHRLECSWLQKTPKSMIAAHSKPISTDSFGPSGPA